MSHYVLAALTICCATIGMSQWAFWAYTITGSVWLTRRVIREMRVALANQRARQAANEASRKAADRLAELVEARRAARNIALTHAGRSAA